VIPRSSEILGVFGIRVRVAEVLPHARGCAPHDAPGGGATRWTVGAQPG
jgi:hypothetical protein